MRNKLGVYLLGLSALFLAAAGPRLEAKFSVSLSIPQPAFDASDLDARDRFNRPIKSVSVRREFQQLWTQSLAEKLLYSLTPLRQRMIQLLNSNWNGFAGVLRRVAETSLQFVRSWLLPKKDRHRLFWRATTVSSVSCAVSTPIVAAGNSFSFLISFIISSTRLLR